MNKPLGQVLYDTHRQTVHEVSPREVERYGLLTWSQLSPGAQRAWQTTAERIKLDPKKVERSPQPPIF